MTIPPVATFDPRTYSCCTYDMFIHNLHGSKKDHFQLCSRYINVFLHKVKKHHLFLESDTFSLPLRLTRNGDNRGQPNKAPENQWNFLFGRPDRCYVSFRSVSIPGSLNNHFLLVVSIGWFLYITMVVSPFPSIKIWFFRVTRYVYLEHKWPLFLKVNPPKQGPFGHLYIKKKCAHCTYIPATPSDGIWRWAPRSSGPQSFSTGTMGRRCFVPPSVVSTVGWRAPVLVNKRGVLFRNL